MGWTQAGTGHNCPVLSECASDCPYTLAHYIDPFAPWFLPCSLDSWPYCMCLAKCPPQETTALVVVCQEWIMRKFVMDVNTLIITRLYKIQIHCPGTPDGQFLKILWFISCIYLALSPQKAFLKGIQTWMVTGQTFWLSHSNIQYLSGLLLLVAGSYSLGLPVRTRSDINCTSPVG